VQIMVFMHGSRIGYFSGDIRKLTEDLMELKPSIFPTVPRLLNRIYDKVAK
jgi:long-chain acyl-CoA synthetase